MRHGLLHRATLVLILISLFVGAMSNLPYACIKPCGERFPGKKNLGQHQRHCVFYSKTHGAYSNLKEKYAAAERKRRKLETTPKDHTPSLNEPPEDQDITMVRPASIYGHALLTFISV